MHQYGDVGLMLPKMKKRFLVSFYLVLFFFPLIAKGEESYEFKTKAPQSSADQSLRLRSNILPWCLAVPNIGGEYAVGEKWSVALDILYCPWKISDNFSIKTVSILPEGRWWLKTNQKGSFFNVHFNLAWFNVRANAYRYQDCERPLLGAGIGYGYRMKLNDKWGMEFEIGAGMANARYERYYNVPNGALKDIRVSTYWGIDRVGVTVTYNLCDL